MKGHPPAPKSKLDGLTDLERRVVKARLENPTADLKTIARLAKVNGATQKSKLDSVWSILRRPRVQTAMREPPPTLSKDPKTQLDLADPQKARDWLLGWYRRIVEGKHTPQSERIRALNAISEMTPGAKVPVGHHHSGTMTLDGLVAEMMKDPAKDPAKDQGQSQDEGEAQKGTIQ